jgi:hypothetical protein
MSASLISSLRVVPSSRKWYETLSQFLIEHGYSRGTIDKTLFIKKTGKDLVLVQVYVDGIILGSTNEGLCKEFEELMKCNISSPCLSRWV